MLVHFAAVLLGAACAQRGAAPQAAFSAGLEAGSLLEEASVAATAPELLDILGILGSTSSTSRAGSPLNMLSNGGISCSRCTSALKLLTRVSKLRSNALNILGNAACRRVAPGSVSCAGFVEVYAPYLTQILPLMENDDRSVFCSSFLNVRCPSPHITYPALSPKPANATAPVPGNTTFNVVHLSDYHLDLDYAVGTEADCGQYLCCRNYTEFDGRTVAQPAARYGAYECDTPQDLASSVFASIRSQPLAFDFGIFTGDLVSHDVWQIKAEYVLLEELTSYESFFQGMPAGVPMYVTLGNHDTWPANLRLPYYRGQGIPFDDELDSFFQANQRNVTDAWARYNASTHWRAKTDRKWITRDVARQAMRGFGSFVTRTKHGLKIFSLQTDFWYADNFYNYINSSDPDPGGILGRLVQELEDSERSGGRVWIIGHVATGGEGIFQGLPAPTNYFNRIVARFSPHVIAGIFFGHTHRDQFSVYYDEGNSPVNVAWIGPSVTPYMHLNAGWRYYEVDSTTFSIMNAKTFYANISDASSDSWAQGGPQWRLEYDAREAYAPATYPRSAPLGGDFWDAVADRILSEPGMRQRYNTYQVKMASGGQGLALRNATVAEQVCQIRASSYDAWQNCQS